MTLDKFITSEHSKYDSWVINNEIPSTVISRTWIHLLMLTQTTSKEDNLTELIVDLAQTLHPIVDHTLSPYNTRPKYEALIDLQNTIHSHHPEKQEYLNCLVFACPPLEYVLDWYSESDEENQFDLQKFNQLYKQLKSLAEAAFQDSVWVR
jgi:hypothetical protein